MGLERFFYIVYLYAFLPLFFRGLLVTALAIFILGFIDAYFGLRFYIIFPFFVAPLVIFIFFFFKSLLVFIFPKKALNILEGWYKKYPFWLKISPNVVFDLLKDKIHPPHALDLEKKREILNKEIKKLIFLPTKILKEEFLGKTNFILVILLLLLYFLLQYFQIPPLYLFKKTEWLSEEDFVLIPKPGDYLMGKPLEISLKYLSPKYYFQYFENAEDKKIFTEKPNFTLDSLYRPYSLRLVVREGAKKLFSKPLLYQPILPGNFRKIVFKITPPATLSHVVSPYVSEDYLLKIHYGSLVKVEVHFSGDADIYWQNKKLPSQNQLAQLSFIFSQNTPQEIYFSLYDKKTRVFFASPKYYLEEAQDLPPTAEILSEKKSFFLPEKGVLNLAYRVQDDFGFRSLSLIVENDKGDIKTWPLAISSRKVEDFFLAQGNFALDLKQVEGQEVRIALMARDNSMIMSSWGKEKAKPGQLALSDFIKIAFAKNREDKEFAEISLQREIQGNLELLREEFQNSEKELEKLFQRMRQKESQEKIEKDLANWLEERKVLQEKIQQYAQMISQSKSSSFEESQRKKFLLNELNFILEEKIAQKEKELYEILKNFPQDFALSEEIKEKLTREEYLKSLENSIRHLKEIQFYKTIKELERKLTQEVRYTENLISQITQKENIKKETLLEKSSEQWQRLKELASTNHTKLNEISQKMLEEINKTQHALEKAQSPEEDIKALSRRKEHLYSWKEELKKLRKESSIERYNKAQKNLQEVALGINHIAEVWHEKSQIARQNNILESNLNQLKKLAKELYTSYEWEIRKLTGEELLSGHMVVLLKEGMGLFRETTKEQYLDFPYTLWEKFQKLRYKLNQISTELLKQMNSWKMASAALKRELDEEELGELLENQKSLGQALRQMGDGKTPEERGLTGLEKAYLENLARSQALLSQKLNQIAKENLTSNINSQELAEIAEEMQKLAEELKNSTTANDFLKLQKREENIEEKFLAIKKGIRKREEWDSEREAVAAREYFIQEPKIEKPKSLPNKIPLFSIPEGERGKFYLRYRQNLEKLYQNFEENKIR